MLIRARGKIQFQPEDKTKKHKSQASWKRVAMIICNDDLADYYAWFLYKRFNLKLNKPLRGTHVTFINDSDVEMPQFDEAAKLFDGKEIDFYIEPMPLSNGEHWWLRVYCPDAESIRIVSGGTPTPFFGMHLTLGYANERNLDHSKYVLDISKRHNIIEFEPRKPFDEHEIVNNFLT